MIWWAVAVGLGASAVTEWVKQLIPWPLTARLKSLMTLVFCILSAGYLTHWGQRSFFVMTMAAFGLAPISHGVESLLRLQRDNAKSQVLIRAKAGGIRR